MEPSTLSPPGTKVRGPPPLWKEVLAYLWPLLPEPEQGYKTWNEARADQVEANGEEQPECEADVDGDEEGEEEEESAQANSWRRYLASHLSTNPILMLDHPKKTEL